MTIINRKIQLYKTKNQTWMFKSSFRFLKLLIYLLSLLLMVMLLFSTTLIAKASSLAEIAEARKYSTIESNDYANWPAGPQITAESAILIEANTGAILYEKNIHKKQSPASTTKLLTGLIASETSELDEVVTFSYEAVFGIERGTSNMGMSDGEAISMEEALYGMLVHSANETSNAIAEHIGGTNEGFSILMNEKAKSLGAINSNFSNPHGLDDENHYTTAYDYSLIAIEFFKNKTLTKMASTPYYILAPSPTQPNENCYLSTHNRLLKGKEFEYESLLGGKTGYTDASRQTLVSAATRNGITLICVIFNDESPGQFLNTIELFEYGFNHFQAVPIATNEDKYSLGGDGSFGSADDIFGDSSPILALNQEDYVVLHVNAFFEDLESFIEYDIDSETSIASIAYTYYETPVGQTTIDVKTENYRTLDFEETSADGTLINDQMLESEASVIEAPIVEETENVIFINVVKVLLWGLLIVGLIILAIYIRALINSYNFNKRRRARIAKRKRRVFQGEFDDFDFD